MIVSYSSQPQGVDQAVAEVAGDTKPAIRLVVGNGLPGHRAKASVNRTIVIPCPRKRLLDGSSRGVAAGASAAAIRTGSGFTRGVIPDLRALVVVGGIRQPVIIAATGVAVGQTKDESSDRHPGVILPVVAVVVPLVLIVVVIFVFCIRAQWKSQETGNRPCCRTRNSKQQI